MMFRKAALALLLGLLSAPASANQWILDNFAGLPVTTGALTGNHVLVYPSLVRDATCTGGYSCIQVMECNVVWTPAINDYACDVPPTYADQRIAFMNMVIGGQSQDGMFGQSILVDGDASGRNDRMDVFMSNVTIAPNWPPFTDYATTNLDGITFDAGWFLGAGGGKHIYVEDLTIACPANPTGSCWADAALDVKPKALQANRLRTEGKGINTLKLWGPGPHYLVNSTINNDRYLDQDPGDDGGLVWARYCDTLVLNIYNSTFNGSPTLPLNKIGCEGKGTPTINYLTVDPTTTGEMHPMFGAVAPPLPPPPPPPVGFGIGAKIKTITTLYIYASGSPTSAIKCQKAAGALGAIIGGPVATVTGTWWQINLNTGCDGWTVQADNRLLLQ